MRHEFHPEALLEFEEAVQFYKDRGRILGQRFAGEIRSAIAKIVATTDRWRVVEQDVRICRARVFPYAVLYTIESDYILIVALAHGKRRPSYWRHRLTTP